MKHTPPKEIELVIPILPNMELAASKTAQAITDYMNLDEEKSSEVSMALIEACINAFEHSESVDKNVYIKFKVRDDALVITIKDRGKGFNSGEVEKPVISNKIHSGRKRGWGLHLMRELMDEVNIESDESGTTITMIKKR